MLSVLNVSYALATVSASAIGGAEQVLATIDRALCANGHRSLVVACRGSSVRGELVATPALDRVVDYDATTRARAHAAHRRAIVEALERWPVDVVHLHGIDFYEYLPPPGVPVLVTLHLPPSWYPEGVLQSDRPDTFFHCVSTRQHGACAPAARLLPPIENGVAITPVPWSRGTRTYALALGRICPEKGYHLALDAARRAGATLLLAGYAFQYESHRRYFDQEIAPRLDDRRRFIGPARYERKRQLLTGARCLVVPSLAPETSSLVAMEALACGTPVIAFPSGALADIVEHGSTGFLVHDVKEMADAIGAAGELDRDACRRAAVTRFSADVMVQRYLERYLALSRGEMRT